MHSDLSQIKSDISPNEIRHIVFENITTVEVSDFGCARPLGVPTVSSTFELRRSIRLGQFYEMKGGKFRFERICKEGAISRQYDGEPDTIRDEAWVNRDPAVAVEN